MNLSQSPGPVAHEGPLALITGVGDGTGAALARRFHAGGYRVAMLARNEARLAALREELPGSLAYAFDLADLDRLGAVLREVRAEAGPACIVIHNAVRASFGSYRDHDELELEASFRINVTALHALARFFLPDMAAMGLGAFLVTGNTAAHRGRPGFELLSSTKAAQRLLIEALARRHWPDGVHVGYITIDAAIDTPWTNPRHPDLSPDRFSLPDDIAREIWHVAHQPRSVWTHDLWLRPFAEPF